ncbi:hypothetical protein SEA_SATIS_134 [Streptomyces phage Satis]|nr:hypothetical protein SEA_SATIS_134 [Streptomyces phage Satis]QBZ72032.1 hypothetical protein SEA_KRADAL_134 [Streptomyces phage Kradal]QPL14452.1 hypothetical protein SEA_EHYELIMAYOE_135 [Streptomyces phage EhyElimayoE]
MKERTFETGGEVLHVGDTVIVFDGNSQREREVTEIGTKRIHIEAVYGGNPVPYSKENRRNLQGNYTSYFRTKTEVAERQRRDLVKSKLRDLGIEARMTGPHDDLDRYPVEMLEEIAGMLEAHRLK